MNQQEIIEKIRSYEWERWLERPFSAFMVSLFMGGSTKEALEKIGVPGVECEAFVYEDAIWYQSQEVFERMEKQLEKYLEHHSMFDITSLLEKFRIESVAEIEGLIENKTSKIEDKVRKVYEILNSVTTYIWLAHGLDHLYDKKSRKLIPEFVPAGTDVDLYIGDASFPEKKNAYAQMEEMIVRGIEPKEIVKKFGWLRIRDGFSDPFTEEEIRNIKVEEHKRQRVEVPEELKDIFKEMQELVYFRTQRTDVLYELLFTARPLLQEVSKAFSIEFTDLKKYSIQSLIEGKPKMFPDLISCVDYKGNSFFLSEPLFKKVVNEEVTQIKGSIAQKGVAQGRVKIVKSVTDTDKVNEGDVLVSQMTVPAFILAMKRAAAFITDEGGITCHAAIIAREMKKPCIIGTKIATQVLKDGDLVEVDAERGIVMILKKAEA